MPLKEPQLLYIRGVGYKRRGEAELCIKDGVKTELRIYPLTQRRIKIMIKDLAEKLI